MVKKELGKTQTKISKRDRAAKNLNYHEQKISINRALHRLYANQ